MVQLRESLSLPRNRCQDNCFGPRSRFSRSGGIWWRHRPIPVKWGRPVGLAALHVSGSQTRQAILSKGELCLGGAPAAATQRGVRLHASNSAVDPNDQRARRDDRTKTWNRAYARGSITGDSPPRRHLSRDRHDPAHVLMTHESPQIIRRYSNAAPGCTLLAGPPVASLRGGRRRRRGRRGHPNETCLGVLGCGMPSSGLPCVRPWLLIGRRIAMSCKPLRWIGRHGLVAISSGNVQLGMVRASSWEPDRSRLARPATQGGGRVVQRWVTRGE